MLPFKFSHFGCDHVRYGGTAKTFILYESKEKLKHANYARFREKYNTCQSICVR